MKPQDKGGNASAALRPYPAYKDSGVRWFGAIPEHWQVQRLGDSVAGCIGGVWGGEPNGCDDLPCVRVADFDRWRLRVRLEKPTVRSIAPSERRRRILKNGDLLIEKSGGGDAQPVGVVVLFDHDMPAVCSNFVARMPVVDGFVSDYLTYLHAYLYAIRVNVRSIKQTTGIQNLDSASYLGEPAAFPPGSEQAAIARFLNCADARIRRYVRCRQKLITLLIEEKRAVVHRAVTRGLDPNVRLKPSGVEWLGDIPEHWEVVLNQRIFKEQIRPHGGQPETQLSLSQRDGLVATRDMQERSLQTSTFDNWKVTVPGDLVLNRFKAHLGVFFAATLRGMVSFHYGVFAPRRRLVTKYFELLYHTNTYRSIFAGCSNGMTVGLQNLSNQNFYGVNSIVPPLEEQEAIVSFADVATKRLDDATKGAHREIELLREYRTRLIADVITGKLDVREAAASLPADLDNLDPIDDEELLADVDEAAEPEVALEEVEA